LRRSSHAEDRPALFAAQFALSHACWLITYPLAGWLGAQVGLGVSFMVLSGLAALAVTVCLVIWRPAHEQAALRHSHDDLPADHPHLQAVGGRIH